MYAIEIQTSDGSVAAGNLQDGAYRIGTGGTCHIQLDGQGISSEHCMLYIRGERAKVADLDSQNGTFLDGIRLSGTPYEVMPGQRILIGDVLIILKGPEDESAGENLPEEESFSAENTSGSSGSPEENMEIPAEESSSQDALSLLSESDETEISEESKEEEKKDFSSELPAKQIVVDGVTLLAVSGVPFHLRKMMQEIKKKAHVELIKRLNLTRLTMSGTSGKELNIKAKETIHEIVSEIKIKLPEGLSKEKIEKAGGSCEVVAQ